MPAISKTWQAITDAQIDPDSPIDAALMQAIRDGLIHLREWVGAGYTAGAVQDHNHDGVNSAAIPVGANSLRNGSFEGNSTAGWTLTPYTGGTLAPSASVYMHGIYSLAITSTVLANGGGDAITADYEEVTGSGQYALKGSLKASVENVSSKIEVIWYDNAKAQISVYSVYSAINTPTTQTDFDSTFYAPATAKFKRLKLTGGVPATGSATGTIYFDGLYAIRPAGQDAAGVIKVTGSAILPEGYLWCNGLDISRDENAGLYQAIGTRYGLGNGTTTFNLPSTFVRGVTTCNPYPTTDYAQAATILNDGRVLVTGGNPGAGAVASTYFGTVNGSVIVWVAGTALPVAFYGHTISLLTDGRVLVTGGYNGADVATTYFGTISGNTITWVAGTAMPLARHDHAATILNDGRILITGGGVTSNTYFGTISGNTITWVAGTALTNTTYNHTANILTDGRVLVTGGLAPANTSNTYFGTISGNTITWVAGTALPVSTYEHTATILNDGRVLITGGITNSNTYFGTISGNTITWIMSMALPVVVSACSAVMMSDGSILITGGVVSAATVDTNYSLEIPMRIIKT